MHGKKKRLVIKPGILKDKNFWWLVGFVQGNGGLERRDGIRLISTDIQILRSAERVVKKLFGLGTSFYIEQSSVKSSVAMMISFADLFSGNIMR